MSKQSGGGVGFIGEDFCMWCSEKMLQAGVEWQAAFTEHKADPVTGSRSCPEGRFGKDWMKLRPAGCTATTSTGVKSAIQRAWASRRSS